MRVDIRGNTCFFSFAAGESAIVALPDGYSFEQIHITGIKNVWGIYQTGISQNEVLIFPPVNSKSPCTLSFNIINTSSTAEIRLTIEKFGQIPDAHYFDNTFEPILVTGDDGNEYNVIPSDQFK